MVSGELDVNGGRATKGLGGKQRWLRRDSREVRNSERRIVVEVIRLYEALKQIPTHLGRLIGACGGLDED